MSQTAICPACAQKQCEDCIGPGCSCDHDLPEDCGHNWDMSCPPCQVCGGCPGCGDCICGEFYDDNEDETMKDGYA